MSALLQLDGARVDVDGVPAVDGLSLASTGERLLVFGAPRALFEAVSGVRAPSHGSVRVGGEDAKRVLASGALAGAPLDPPLPLAWTPRKYVTWSARLAGRGRAEAQAAAGEAIRRMKLESMADAPIAKSANAARRATSIAAALATGAKTIVLDDPLVGLPETHARAIGRILAAALEDRAWIAFVSRAPLESPLALHADEAIVLAGSRVAAQGPPAEVATRDRAYALRVEGDAAALARRLRELGARVSGDPAAMTVDLGEISTRAVMAAALENGAVVVEIRPASVAFS